MKADSSLTHRVTQRKTSAVWISPKRPRQLIAITAFFYFPFCLLNQAMEISNAAQAWLIGCVGFNPLQNSPMTCRKFKAVDLPQVLVWVLVEQINPQEILIIFIAVFGSKQRCNNLRLSNFGYQKQYVFKLTATNPCLISNLLELQVSFWRRWKDRFCITLGSVVLLQEAKKQSSQEKEFGRWSIFPKQTSLESNSEAAQKRPFNSRSSNPNATLPVLVGTAQAKEAPNWRTI